MTFWNILCIAISVALALTLLGCALYIIASALIDEYFMKKSAFYEKEEEFFKRMMIISSESMEDSAKGLYDIDAFENKE